MIEVQTQRIMELLQKFRDLGLETGEESDEVDKSNIPADPEVMEYPPVQQETPVLKSLLAQEGSDLNESQNTESEMTQNTEPMELSLDDKTGFIKSIGSSGDLQEVLKIRHRIQTSPEER
ncbi:hypothetical protein RF11_00866 [Thelohanellus kitauei]|uniref:Uncharacterized protein n=1 Tax=Thelohanellus kitauei TaxID=669202 RepID=A0A0C2J7Z6_THEKT|nr:hypothetical protein RF11_00866 [Thelohanellus kitauei]